MSVNIYKVESGYVVSENNVWIEGCYESEAAAKYAVAIKPEFIKMLMDKSETKVLTLAELKSLPELLVD